MMRVSVGIEYGHGVEVWVTEHASGRYAPDIVDDLNNRARAALKEAVALLATSSAQINATDEDDDADALDALDALDPDHDEDTE